jgi:hypothetical protein
MTTKKTPAKKPEPSPYVKVKGYVDLQGYGVSGYYYLKVGDMVSSTFRSRYNEPPKHGGTVIAVKAASDFGSGAWVRIAYPVCLCCGRSDPVDGGDCGDRGIDACYAIPVKVRRSIPKKKS